MAWVPAITVLLVLLGVGTVFLARRRGARASGIVIGAGVSLIATSLGYAAGWLLLDQTSGAHPEAGQLRAVQSGAVWALDANRWFSRPAPGLVRGAELLAQIFRGGADVPGQAIKVSPGRDPGR